MITFAMHKPKRISRYPMWTTPMNPLEGSLISLGPKNLAYNRPHRRYVFQIETKISGMNASYTCAAWWLEQVDNKDKRLVIARRKKPYRIACVKHFLKEKEVPFHVLNWKYRVSFIATPDILEELDKMAHIVVVGKYWEEKENKKNFALKVDETDNSLQLFSKPQPKI